MYDRLWRCKVLPSVQVTVWWVLSNKIATTRVNLEMCGVVIKNMLCSLCGMEEERRRVVIFFFNVNSLSRLESVLCLARSGVCGSQ